MKEVKQMLIDAITKKQEENLLIQPEIQWDYGHRFGYDKACIDILELVKGILP